MRGNVLACHLERVRVGGSDVSVLVVCHLLVSLSLSLSR